MSSSETLDDRKRIKSAASKSQLNNVIELSQKFSYDVELLSDTLILSCKEGHLDVVKWMVEHTTADINYFGVIRVTNALKEERNLHYSPMMAACYWKHLDIVKYLVKTSRVNVNLADIQDGYTPLLEACASSCLPVSMFLLYEVTNLDVNITDRRSNNALHFAVSSSKDHGYTQLHLACIKGNKSEVMRLVSTDNSIINVQENNGRTPLHLACYCGHSDIVKYLMLDGADETINNINWKTPAQMAIKKGHKKLLKLLNRETLWKVMQTTNFKKLPVSFIVILALQLLQLKLIRKKMCHMLRIVHVLFTFNKSWKLH